MHKFRTKDQNGKSNNLGDDNWVWQGVKLHEIKSLKAIMGAIKKIERIGPQLKFTNLK
jgi:hypothetical protein